MYFRACICISCLFFSVPSSRCCWLDSAFGLVRRRLWRLFPFSPWLFLPKETSFSISAVTKKKHYACVCFFFNKNPSLRLFAHNVRYSPACLCPNWSFNRDVPRSSKLPSSFELSLWARAVFCREFVFTCRTIKESSIVMEIISTPLPNGGLEARMKGRAFVGTN